MVLSHSIHHRKLAYGLSVPARKTNASLCLLTLRASRRPNTKSPAEAGLFDIAGLLLLVRGRGAALLARLPVLLLMLAGILLFVLIALLLLRIVLLFLIGHLKRLSVYDFQLSKRTGYDFPHYQTRDEFSTIAAHRLEPFPLAMKNSSHFYISLDVRPF
jgi:hypothetical protein